MNKMKKKKSSGNDGISQECLLEGAEILTIPLKRLINTSIENGIFPEEGINLSNWRTNNGNYCYKISLLHL